MSRTVVTYRRHGFLHGIGWCFFWGAIAFWPLGAVGWNVLGFLAEFAWLGFAVLCHSLARRLEQPARDAVAPPHDRHHRIQAFPEDDGRRLI